MGASVAVRIDVPESFHAAQALSMRSTWGYWYRGDGAGMNVRFAASSTLVGPLLCAASVAGCHGCHEDHPYVPYTIGSSELSPVEPSAAPRAATVTDPQTDSGHVAFASAPAAVAPVGLARWPLEGVVIQAPDGQTFVSAVVRDFDGDGEKDAVAVVRAAEGNDAGKVLYYRGLPHGGGFEEPVIFAPPAGLFADAGCTPSDRLVAIGPRSVLVEIGAACPARPAAQADRWVAVVSGGGAVAAPRAQAAHVVLAAMVTDPPGSAGLVFDADVTDRDGDGLRDVALRVAIERGESPTEPQAAGVLAWVDRPAGLSQDLSATQASFDALARVASARAVRLKEAGGVPAFVAEVRDLWRSVCAEGGAPRLVGIVGIGPVTCSAGRTLEDVGLAEVRAYATAGDPLHAALALDRAERPPATRNAARVADANRWITQGVSVVSARALRAIAAVPMIPGGREPAWGSLAFEPNGMLLVRTRAGLVQVDPEAGDEVQATGVADWKPAVTSPDGALRYTDTYDPCAASGLRAVLACTGSDCVREVALPVMPPLGGHCTGARGASVRALPIAWGPGGLEALIDGEFIWVSPDLSRATTLPAPLGQPAVQGSPRSPGGNALVVATGAGLFVRGARRARLLRASELDGTYLDQRDCVVSNDEEHVACVRAGAAWVGAWN